jgi:hypothetical protein
MNKTPENSDNSKKDDASDDLLVSAMMEPNWSPILAKLGDELCKPFTFMASYPAAKNFIHTYKHRETRRYLNMDETGQCYAYNHGGYVAITDEEAFSHVFG